MLGFIINASFMILIYFMIIHGTGELGSTYTIYI